MPPPQIPPKWQVQIAVGISVAIFFGMVLALRTRTHDFTNVYTAARIMCQGEGTKLYALQKQAEVEEAVFHWGHLFVFNHPPFEAWFFAPLGRLPYVYAYVIWGAVNIALWVFFLVLLRPYVPSPANPFQYVLLCFLFFPIWIALMQGQTSILLLVLLSLAYVSLKRGREGWAGVFIGMGLFKFPVVLPLALIFLLKRKWRLIAGFMGAAFVLGVVSLVAVGLAGMVGYFNLLVDQMRRPTYLPYGIGVAGMPNLRGFFRVILLPVVPGYAVNVAVALTSFFLIGYVAWRWRHEDSGEGQGFDLMFASALAISEVTAYHLIIHDLSPTLLAVLLTLSSARYPKGSLWHPARTAAIAALYVLPVFLLMLPVGAMSMLTPFLILLAWAAMAGNSAARA